MFLSSHILSEVDRDLPAHRPGSRRAAGRGAHAQRAACRCAATHDGAVLDAGQRRHARAAGRDARLARAGAMGARRAGSAGRDHSALWRICRSPMCGSRHSRWTRPSFVSSVRAQARPKGSAGQEDRQSEGRALRRGGPTVTALVLRSLGRVRILSAALAVVLVGLQLSIIAAAATFVDTGGFERLAQVGAVVRPADDGTGAERPSAAWSCLRISIR